MLINEVEVASKFCRKCGKEQPLTKFKRNSWGVCVDCLPKQAQEPPKKRGRPKNKVVVKEVLVVPDPEPSEPSKEEPDKTEEKPKKPRLRRSVRQLNTEEMKRLLNKFLPMELRAQIMCELAKQTNEPVTALRALSDINSLTGISVESMGKAAVPLFALPKGTDVKIVADKVEIKSKNAAD